MQDIALFNHWNETVGHSTLQDPDFFKTLPRTLSDVLEWFQRNITVLKEAKTKTLRNFDPDFDMQGLEALVARERQVRNHSAEQHEEATVEFLDDEFGFHGMSSKPVYGIARNPGKKRLTVVFRGSINPRDWAQDFQVQEKEVALTPEELIRVIPNPNKELLRDFENVKVHTGFHDYLFEEEGKNETKWVEITKEVMQRLKDPRNDGYALYFAGHSLGKKIPLFVLFPSKALAALNTVCLCSCRRGPRDSGSGCCRNERRRR